MKNIKKFLICLLIFVLNLIILTACETNDGENKADITKELNTNNTDNEKEAGEIKVELIKTHDEKHGRYNFAYKRSALSVRKEMFEKYELTDGHIQKFFDIAEMVYDKLSDFFPQSSYYAKVDPPRPEIISYHSVSKQWGYEPYLYADYSYSSSQSNAWADPWSNATYYAEGLLEQYLTKIDIGFPAIVCHELGHLFIYGYYIWDWELLCESAKYYLTAEFPVIDSIGGITSPHDWKNFSTINLDWRRFFGLADKYGYEIISDTLKEMQKLTHPNYETGNDNEALFKLFRQVLTQKTGDDIDYYFADLSNTVNIQGVNYDITMSSFALVGDFNDSDIEALSGMTGLTNLTLFNNQISEISLLLIDTLANLPNFTHLDLAMNPITDISALARLTNLTNLVLFENQISDISALAGLKNLTTLFLENNPLTAEQIAELREALPDTKIFADY